MKLVYILSLPRSGSTVLSAILDRRKGIVSPPESSFPQVLSVITPEERNDPRRLASLYLGATFVPTPLSLAEAEACMGGTDREILIGLGLAVAEKLGRDRAEVKAIVWKTPRTVGMHRVPLETDGRFIVLRRNPHNVFESQFRVEFGTNNRKPWRFAVFRESYEHAFARLPKDRVIEIEYDALPGAVDDILRFLDLENAREWESQLGSLDAAAEKMGHMAEVTKEFRNRDPEKRARLEPAQIRTLDRAMALARPIRGLLGPVRAHFDMQSMGPIRDRAERILNEWKHR